MKNLLSFSVLFLIVYLCHAQDDPMYPGKKLKAAKGHLKCKLVVNENDSFSGKRKIVTDSYGIGKIEGMNKNLFGQIRMVDGYYFLSVFSVVDMGCASHDSKVELKAINGTIYEQQHVGDIDCGKVTSAYSSIPPYMHVNLPDSLQDQEYTMLRVTFSDSRANVILNRPTMLKELCDCVKNAQ